MSEKEKEAFERLLAGELLVIDSSETGPDYVDFWTATALRIRGLARVERRLFHTFLWLV
jgi:hypothetical protein